MSRLSVIRVYKSLKRGGGVHGRLMELLPRLAEFVELRVLCYREAGDRAAELEALGIPVDVIPLGSKWAPWNVRRYVGYFRAHRPDIVHTHEYTANTLAICAAAAAGVPVRIRHLHTMAPWGWGTPIRRRMRIRTDVRAARRSGLTLAVSDAVRELYLATTGLDHASCRVLYNGIDLARFALDGDSRMGVRGELGVPAVAPLVGMVGRLSRGKGGREFLLASAEVARTCPDAHFVLVGDGGLRGELEALAAQSAVADRMHFTGLRQDVPALLRAMDLFLFPSVPDPLGRIQDGLPGVVLEAMAAGLPVVAFDLPMMSEMVEDGVTGERVAVGDVAAMARRAVALLADRDQLAAMGKRARDHVQRFSLDRCVHETVALYQELSSPAGGG